MYDCHEHGAQAGDHCPHCEVRAYVPPPAIKQLIEKYPLPVAVMSIQDHEEMQERIRMLNDIALSAIGLKMQIEIGIKEPSLHALNRDLDAYKRRFGGSLPAGLRATLRPANYAELPQEKQWQIDKTLGLLDWDGHEDQEKT
jgi:hypothetical protein